MSPAPPAGRVPVVLAMAAATFVSAMGNSMTTVVLPQLRAAFAASSVAVGWTATAQLLAYAVCTPVIGGLSAATRLRGLFAGGTAVFAVSSVLAGAAPTMGVFVAARAGQGIGAAALTALASIVVARSMPAARQGRAFGVVAAGTAVGQAAGPAIGGVVAQLSGWRPMFAVTAAVAGLVLAAAWRGLGRVPAGAGAGRVDALGAVLLAGATAGGMYWLTMRIAGPGGGWVIGALAAGCAAGFVLRIRWAAVPFVPPALLRDLRFDAACAFGFLGLAAFLATETIVPLLGAAGGLGSAAVGLVLLPGTVAAIAAAPLAGRWVDAAGCRRVGAAGLALAGAAFLWLSTVAGHAPWLVGAGMLGVGAGFAAATVAGLAAASLAVRERDGGRHSGIGLGVFHSGYAIGGACGAVLAPAVLQLRAGSAGWNPLAAAPAYADALLTGLVPVLLAALVLPLLPSRAVRLSPATDTRRSPARRA